MHLSVAFVPPDHAVDHAAAAFERVPRGPAELDVVPRDSLLLPVFGLGNLTRPDARVVCTRLGEIVAEWQAAAVGFAGSWVLEGGETDTRVGTRLTGDADRVRTVATSLHRAVSDLGFYVDRRRFAPLLAFGTVTDGTTLRYLASLVEALDAYRGPPWQVASVDVVTRVFRGEGGPALEVLESLPLAAAPAPDAGP